MNIMLNFDKIGTNQTSNMIEFLLYGLYNL